MCQDLNIEQEVLHCGWINFDNLSLKKLEDEFEKFAEVYNILSNFLDDFGVKLGLENQYTEDVYHCILGNLNIIDKFNEHANPRMKFVLDMGHLERTVSLVDMIDKNGKNFIGVNIHDYNDQGKDHHPLGIGQLKINKLLCIINYKDVFITIENRYVQHKNSLFCIHNLQILLHINYDTIINCINL